MGFKTSWRVAATLPPLAVPGSSQTHFIWAMHAFAASRSSAPAQPLDEALQARNYIRLALKMALAFDFKKVISPKPPFLTYICLQDPVHRHYRLRTMPIHCTFASGSRSLLEYENATIFAVNTAFPRGDSHISAKPLMRLPQVPQCKARLANGHCFIIT